MDKRQIILGAVVAYFLASEKIEEGMKDTKAL